MPDVIELLLSDRPFSGDKNQRVHKYKLRCEGLTDEDVFDWLLGDNKGAYPNAVVERPDGTLLGPTGPPLLKTYDGRILSDVRYQLRMDCDPEFYEVSAVYDFPGGGGGGGGASGEELEPKKGVDGIEFSFEEGPENETIKQSIKTVGRYGPVGGPSAQTRIPPHVFRAINLQDDGTVEGLQVPDSPQQFAFKYTNDASFFTAEKRTQIALMRGKVNSVEMNVGGVKYDPGEVRFLGATGAISNSVEVNSTIELRFGVRENQINLMYPGIRWKEGRQEDDQPIENQEQGIIKDGWDYLWIYWGKGVDDNGRETSKPRGLYVERIFERDDLNALVQ